MLYIRPTILFTKKQKLQFVKLAFVKIFVSLIEIVTFANYTSDFVFEILSKEN